MSIKTRTSGIMVNINVEPAGGGPFHANAVTFDGTNDFLTRGAALSGAVDSKVAIISFWFKMNDDGTNEGRILCDAAGTLGFTVARLSAGAGNTLSFADNVTGNLRIRTNTSFVSPMNWTHALCSFDLATAMGTVYINNVDDTNVGLLILNNVTQAWSAETDWAVGASPAGSGKASMDIAELYFNIATSFDLTNAANRAKFIDQSTLKPVYLGANGEVPTGTAPIVFFTNPTATWENNVGGGLGFTENGALTTAPTSPSD